VIPLNTVQGDRGSARAQDTNARVLVVSPCGLIQSGDLPLRDEGRGTTKRRDDEVFPRSICMSNEATVDEHSLESFFLSPYTRKYTRSWAPHGLGPRRLSMVAMGQRRPCA
jgi:hypothetical protein